MKWIRRTKQRGFEEKLELDKIYLQCDMVMVALKI